VNKIRIKGILILVLVALMAGCGALGIITQEKPNVCITSPEATDSYICATLTKLGVEPKDANILFKFVNVELIRQKAYSKIDFLYFLDNIESILNTDTSYVQIVSYILHETDQINGIYGAEFVLLSDYFNAFKSPKLISEFDIQLLKIHIKEQREILVFIK